MSCSRRYLLRAAALALVLPAGLAGCGFEPLYGRQNGNATVDEFRRILIAQAEDRTTQLVRNHLLDMLTPRGTPEQPAYRLELHVRENISSVLVTRADEVTRNNMALSIEYRLHDYRSGRILAQGNVNSLVSYNLVRADYANLVSERDARARAARDGAERLRIMLGNFFSRRQHQNQPQSQPQNQPQNQPRG